MSSGPFEAHVHVSILLYNMSMQQCVLRHDYFLRTCFVYKHVEREKERERERHRERERKIEREREKERGRERERDRKVERKKDRKREREKERKREREKERKREREKERKREREKERNRRFFFELLVVCFNRYIYPTNITLHFSSTPPPLPHSHHSLQYAVFLLTCFIQQSTICTLCVHQ
jgi:hypothetical protein